VSHKLLKLSILPPSIVLWLVFAYVALSQQIQFSKVPLGGWRGARRSAPRGGARARGEARRRDARRGSDLAAVRTAELAPRRRTRARPRPAPTAQAREAEPARGGACEAERRLRGTRALASTWRRRSRSRRAARRSPPKSWLAWPMHLTYRILDSSKMELCQPRSWSIRGIHTR
jgi:hypothetical protein